MSVVSILVGYAIGFAVLVFAALVLALVLVKGVDTRARKRMRESEIDASRRRARETVGAWDSLIRASESTKPGPEASIEQVLAWAQRTGEATENLSRDLAERYAALS